MADASEEIDDQADNTSGPKYDPEVLKINQLIKLLNAFDPDTRPAIVRYLVKRFPEGQP